MRATWKSRHLTPMSVMFTASIAMVGYMAGVGALAAADGGEPATMAGHGPVTFSKDIAPIFQAKCQECHQPNSIAPMSLITFQEARPWARSIKERVATRQMPPWHIDRSVGVQKFKNDMSLTDEQVDTIVRWVDGGALQGDPKDLPPPKPLVTDNEWKAVRDGFGPPDMVDPVARIHDGRRSTRMCGTGLCPTFRSREPRWAKMVEIRPTTLKGRRVIHHSIAYLVLNNDPEAVNTGTATGNRADEPDRPGQPAAAVDGVGHRQGLRPVPARHREVDRSGREDFLGSAYSRRGRRDHGRF